MSKYLPFNLFMRQALLYPLTAPFLPPVDKVEEGFDYAAGKLTGELVVPVPLWERNSETGVLTPATVSDTIEVASVKVDSDKAFYLGAEDVNGSWRFIRSGDFLIIQRRESTIWVEKGAFLT